MQTSALFPMATALQAKEASVPPVDALTGKRIAMYQFSSAEPRTTVGPASI